MWKRYVLKRMLSLSLAASTFLLGAWATRALAPRPSEPVLLEVLSRDGGMVCTTEQYLELRVYVSGRVEGDVFNGQCMARSRFFSSFKRQTTQLDNDELARLKAALSQPELSTVKQAYPAFAIYTDSGTFQTIAFVHEDRRQTVQLVNPDPTNPQNQENYPPSLIRLLLETKQIRQRFDASIK